MGYSGLISCSSGSGYRLYTMKKLYVVIIFLARLFDVIRANCHFNWLLLAIVEYQAKLAFERLRIRECVNRAFIFVAYSISL